MTAFRMRPRELGRLRRDVAMGGHNAGLAVQAASMRHTPVHGGFRSFTPGATPIGGTLRRSHFTATFLDGVQIAGPAIELPDGVPTSGMVTVVGTSSGYGYWVHEGTSKMESRPFLLEGLFDERGSIPALMAAGARRAGP